MRKTPGFFNSPPSSPFLKLKSDLVRPAHRTRRVNRTPWYGTGTVWYRLIVRKNEGMFCVMLARLMSGRSDSAYYRCVVLYATLLKAIKAKEN